MATARRRKSRGNHDGMEIASNRKTDTTSRILLHWPSSSWSDVMAEMTSFYKQNFKHLIPIESKAKSKYSTGHEERSSKKMPDLIQAQHHAWRPQNFEELPAWRQENFEESLACEIS